ncbi:tyrosine-type recombinase/integrase [Gottfriedia sp. NPDC057948]|uniref:tyrosine-type recombinase/integrase n=1 Tax=Gottfriedia sp. NPDC057948 TaxID=3346287 RepID=UPI0036DA295F
MIKTFNHDHVKAIINFYNGKFYLDIRNKTLVTMLIETGIRNSEIRQIQLNDISDNAIRILGKGNKIRYVPISLHLQKQLYKFLRKREEYINGKGFTTLFLFVSTHGGMLTIKMPLNVVKRACLELGIEDVNGIVHNCRRYYAQTMLDNTDIYTVSRLLGHTELRTTQIYLNSTDDKVILERGMNSPLSKFK